MMMPLIVYVKILFGFWVYGMNVLLPRPRKHFKNVDVSVLVVHTTSSYTKYFLQSECAFIMGVSDVLSLILLRYCVCAKMQRERASVHVSSCVCVCFEPKLNELSPHADLGRSPISFHSEY